MKIENGLFSGSGNERREEEQENKRGRKRQLKLTSEHVTVRNVFDCKTCEHFTNSECGHFFARCVER